jgi:mRNA interferase RelE/StbE
VYQIVFTKQAAKSLRSISPEPARLIQEKLAQIASNPYASHTNVTKLQGRPGYRLRVGEWRVIYEIQNEEVLIILLRIAPRSEVYR